MSLAGTLLRLKFRLIAHGPNAERGFGLITGTVFAGLVVGLAFFVTQVRIDSDWLLLTLTIWGLFWPLVPLIQPTFSEALLRYDWLRTLPTSAWRRALALSTTESIGVGPLVTILAFISLAIIAKPTTLAGTLLVILAIITQVYFFVWLGKATVVLVGYFMRLRFGRAIAATQMSLLLALSFAGWVPIAAHLLPKLGSGSTEMTNVALTGQFPDAAAEVLANLPTGWGFAAVQAVSADNYQQAAYLVMGLSATLLLFWFVWMIITVKMLRKPPARQVSGVKTVYSLEVKLLERVLSPQIYGTFLRELKTWFRDPVRSLEMRHAWLTPAIIAILIGISGWDWALPFVGLAAVLFGAMVAVNTYALDGTAFWQLIVTPGALRADLIGRQLAWVVLFGLPSVIITIVFAALTQSPLSLFATSGVIIGVATSCALAPLLALTMPAIGTDARNRVRLGERAGDPTGAQMTIFPLILLTAVLPVIAIASLELNPVVAIIAALVIALAIWQVVYRLTIRWLDQRSLQFYTNLRAGKTYTSR